MTRRNLDWRNPLGEGTYKCFRHICVMEKNMLEAARDNGGLSTVQAISNQPTGDGVATLKNKAKGVFTTFDNSDPEDEVSTNAHTVASHSNWIKPGSQHKFPCPLQNHNHEIAACVEFLTLTPKDRWFKIPRGRICYTCLKPKGAKGICKTKQCAEEKTIPQVLLCAACTPWAAAKGWASFSILMCRKQEHGKDRPKPAEIRKVLEKYLGKSNTAIPDNKLSYAVNFNYQIFSVSDLPKQASACTPTFDSDLGVEIDTATVTIIPEVPEHSFYLMQWLRIGRTNRLVFFYRGANAHLVQGKMAEAA